MKVALDEQMKEKQHENINPATELVKVDKALKKARAGMLEWGQKIAAQQKALDTMNGMKLERTARTG